MSEAGGFPLSRSPCALHLSHLSQEQSRGRLLVLPGRSISHGRGWQRGAAKPRLGTTGLGLAEEFRLGCQGPQEWR